MHVYTKYEVSVSNPVPGRGVHDRSFFLYLLSIVVRTCCCIVLCLACERVGYGCALLVALGNAVRWSGDHLGSYVLSQ